MDFEVAVLRNKIVEVYPFDNGIYIIKDDKKMHISYELFYDLYHVMDDSWNAAFKSDCILYRDVDDGVLLRNKLNVEMTIPLHVFIENYRV